MIIVMYYPFTRSWLKGTKINECFDEYATYYELFNVQNDYASDVAHLLDYSEIDHGDICLEIGSGSGRASSELTKFFTFVCGLEPSLAMCKIANFNLRELPNFHCIQGSLSHIDRDSLIKLFKSKTKNISNPIILITGIFHVFNYLSSSELTVIAQFADQLSENGFQVLLAFDHWSSEAVRKYPPEITVKKAISKGLTLTRTIKPSYDSLRKCWVLEILISQEEPREVLCVEYHSIFVHTDSQYISTFNNFLLVKDTEFSGNGNTAHSNSYGRLKVFRSKKWNID